MAGSALIWRTGHYRFGNADQQSAANVDANGNPVQNPRVAAPEENLDGDNPLLQTKKKVKHIQTKTFIIITFFIYSADHHMMYQISY